jgi:hypothetical protein
MPWRRQTVKRNPIGPLVFVVAGRLRPQFAMEDCGSGGVCPAPASPPGHGRQISMHPDRGPEVKEVRASYSRFRWLCRSIQAPEGRLSNFLFGEPASAGGNCPTAK